MEAYHNYENVRFVHESKRSVVWSEISRYLQRYLLEDSTILDVGSGYCDFINFIKAKKKFALDKYIEPARFVLEGTIYMFGDSSLLDNKIKNCSLDVAFASNLFEHLDEKELNKYLDVIRKKLSLDRVLMILQPNYRLCYKNYFDDYTHAKAWTDYCKKWKIKK